ncbi:hypothetical protein [Hydrogenovibrio sp. JE_KL2]|uniref:hypothetical protein n=1 Tax=Hydrogenovibrio sp. JE_KL2 TaxID=2651188 RepID=UPI00128E2F2A|nr:hypothetical protein [Hydrogenovibrio sp. JE_KL2]MPQ77513.1 hypothetical protein [Hydrogenovibrio sp. JE_KL2]
MLNRKLWKEYFLLTVAFAWSMFSYFFTLSGTQEVWFARSGALMVFAAVTVEFRLAGILQKSISDANTVAGLGIPAGVSVPKANKILAITAHLFALTGTLIWAYGDLFYV